MASERPASWFIECACGYTARGENQEETATDVRKHAKEAHGVDIEREAAIDMARPE